MERDEQSEPTMLTVHLVRHGETDWNRERRLQGWTDIPLNPHGVEQAEAAARVLAARPVRTVVSSDLARARETAVRIAVPHGLAVSSDAALRERTDGAAEGWELHAARRYSGSWQARGTLTRWRLR